MLDVTQQRCVKSECAMRKMEVEDTPTDDKVLWDQSCCRCQHGWPRQFFNRMDFWFPDDDNARCSVIWRLLALQ